MSYYQKATPMTIQVREPEKLEDKTVLYVPAHVAAERKTEKPPIGFKR